MTGKGWLCWLGKDWAGVYWEGKEGGLSGSVREVDLRVDSVRECKQMCHCVLAMSVPESNKKNTWPRKINGGKK